VLSPHISLTPPVIFLPNPIGRTPRSRWCRARQRSRRSAARANPKLGSTTSNASRSGGEGPGPRATRGRPAWTPSRPVRCGHHTHAHTPTNTHAQTHPQIKEEEEKEEEEEEEENDEDDDDEEEENEEKEEEKEKHSPG
jgi:hypothetical protein